ncbi:hydrogenase maturation protease [Parasalinivibrio latis]|uniref:hydrogenase maturation protease n=1 Tax=Parasalinivibrio latis TaxID=2952610 RepID=UPI0030E3A1DF
MKSTVDFPSLDRFDLIYGIGNIGRQDDGIGWAFVDAVEEQGLSDAKLIRHYQLFFEDVDLIRRYNRVLFVDATKAVQTSSFAVERVIPKLDDSFTSHAISVQTIVAMCHQCYRVFPEVWLLTVRGYEWELKLGLTAGAAQNLSAALDGVKGKGLTKAEPVPQRAGL